MTRLRGSGIDGRRERTSKTDHLAAAALQADGVPVGTLVSDLRLVTPADLPLAADAATGARPAIGANAVA